MSRTTNSNSLITLLKPFYLAMISIAFIALIGAIVVYVFQFGGELSKSQDIWGQFGDFFGGTLNPLFGFLSLLALLFTIHVQTKELSHSSAALFEQSEHLEQQAFENTFFSMLRICRENVVNIELKHGNQPKIGFKAMAELAKRMKDTYEADESANKTKSEEFRESEDQLVNSSYRRFYAVNQTTLGLYLRMLEQLFLFIDRNSPNEDAEQYWNIVRAQLSEYELVLVFYHAFTHEGQFYEFEKLQSKSLFRFLMAKGLNSILHVGLLEIEEDGNGSNA